MYVKKNLLIMAATLAVILVAITATWIRVVRAESSTFTIKYLEIGGTLKRDSFYARRTDGSTVESLVTSAPDGKEYGQRTVINTTAKHKVVIDGITESITTYPLTERYITGYKKPPLKCVPDDSNPPESSYLSYAIFERSNHLPAPEYRRSETWHAPDLGCVILRSYVFGKDAEGKETKLWSKEAVSIMTSDPDPSLFLVPEWPERSPSQVMTLFENKYGVTEPINPHFDQAYSAAQQHR